MEKEEYESSGKSSVIRGKIGDRITYVRIPIINKYPLPNENTHPIEALYLYLRYINFQLNQAEEKDEHLIEVANKALNVFKTFEVIDTELLEQ